MAAGHRSSRFCLGAYVLAYFGSLYTSDERLITSSGTAAGIDCCLNIIRDHYGLAVANRVARRMVVPPYREGGQAQFIERPVPVSTRDRKMNELMDYLHRNLNKPHDLDSLAGIDAGWYSLVTIALSTERSRNVYIRFKTAIDRVAGSVMALLGLKLIISSR